MSDTAANHPSAPNDLLAPSDLWIDVRPDAGGVRLHVRAWAAVQQTAVQQTAVQQPFVLVHGLSSNARTWDQVAGLLAAAGHAVFAVDQRGHGLSDKPDDAYDFATMTEDLLRLLDALGLARPVLVGQSWGGNVVLEFGARYPGRAGGLGLIDGGVLDLQAHPDHADWGAASAALRPPPLAGTPRHALKQMIAAHNPEWSDAGLEATLANFETLPDGTVRPWLTLERHLRILRALWEQRPGNLYPQVREGVVICAADDGQDSVWSLSKQRMVAAAQAALAHSSVHWFHKTAHDIHVHRPVELVSVLRDELAHGVWSNP